MGAADGGLAGGGLLMAKRGRARKPARPQVPPLALDDPALLDAASERWGRLKAVAEEAGVGEDAARRLVQRIQAKYGKLDGELKELKTSELLLWLNDRARRALEWLDDTALAGASAKDLAIVVGILLEKRQLLRGEPTQILSVEERRRLDELVPVLLREAQRRGMLLEFRGPTVDVTPREKPQLLGAAQHGTDMWEKRWKREKDEIGEP